MHFILYTLIPLLLGAGGNQNTLSVEHRTGLASNKPVTLVFANEANVEFTLKRPDFNDPDILLCVPAAFTDLKTFKVDGLCIEKGNIAISKVNRTLTGAALFGLTGFHILKTDSGKKCDNVIANMASNPKQSYFQQVLLVHNGEVVPHPDRSYWERRAICIMKDGRIAIAEGHKRTIYNKFSSDLTSFGDVEHALYLDMGAWDEGWYKNPETGNKVSMGTYHSATDKQSNWIVFRR